ncbi:hypothetical protein ACS0TY_034498 [Phlomoides rotata]
MPQSNNNEQQFSGTVKPAQNKSLSASDLEKLQIVTGKDLVLCTDCAVCLDIQDIILKVYILHGDLSLSQENNRKKSPFITISRADLITCPPVGTNLCAHHECGDVT